MEGIRRGRQGVKGVLLRTVISEVKEVIQGPKEMVGVKIKD